MYTVKQQLRDASSCFRRQFTFRVLVVVAAVILISAVSGSSVWAQCRTYTLDADFDSGFMINVNHDAPNNDQLQLNTIATTFPFICVAASDRGTVVRVNTNTGQIVGEYLSAPDGMGRNPSRTTVDLQGNVWVANRNESSGGKGSVTRIALIIGGSRVNSDGTPNPSGQYLAPPFIYSTAVDRDFDGLIKTSLGLGDILPWINAGGVDNNGGVSTAEDECIINYTRVTGAGTRTVAVDASNDIWVGGYSDQDHEKVDGVNGQPVAGTQFNASCGGYGGVVDGNGILWSADISGQKLLRYDPGVGWTCIPLGAYSYGLGIDNSGNIWNSNWSHCSVKKISPAGAILATYALTAGGCYRGVAITASDDNVWIANSCGNNVKRLSNAGAILATIPVGTHPTGVAVDANGKVWVTNYHSDDIMRIDPGTNTVDLTVSLGSGAGPYNYSDMTGIVAMGTTAPQGTWTVTYDGVNAVTNWGMVCWNGEACATQPAGSNITARARSSEDQVTWSAWEAVANCVDITVPDGRYLEVEMKLTPNAQGESPILCDVTICTGIQEVAIDIKPESCPNAMNIARNWEKSRGVLPVAVLGTEDFDVTQIDPASILLEGVSPLRWALEDVSTPLGPDPEECECNELAGDGYLDLTLKFMLAEIVATFSGVQDGDVIPLTLTGTNLDGTQIEGVDCVLIRFKGKFALRIDSDGSLPTEFALLQNYPNPFNPTTEMSFSLPEAAFVSLAVFNVMGQKVATLVDGYREAGIHTASWDGTNVASGIYLYRLTTDYAVETRKMLLLK